jgi:hypothetical protein
MEQIKLEVGKRYVVRDPQRVKSLDHQHVIEIIDGDGVLFKGGDGSGYYKDGRIDLFSLSPFDLVREVQPQNK